MPVKAKTKQGNTAKKARKPAKVITRSTKVDPKTAGNVVTDPVLRVKHQLKMARCRSNNPGSPKNLAKPFVQGKSGNPAGCPKGVKHGIRARLRKMLASPAPAQFLDELLDVGLELTEKDCADVVAAVLTKQAMSGDQGAMKLALDHTERPMKQVVGLEGGEDGSPIQFVLPPMPSSESDMPDNTEED